MATPESLDHLMDIPVEITVELGSTEMSLKNVMGLASGSIIELDKKADEPVNLYVNHKLVAHGEVVVVENNLGIKIIDVVNAEPAAAAAAADATPPSKPAV